MIVRSYRVMEVHDEKMWINDGDINNNNNNNCGI